MKRNSLTTAVVAGIAGVAGFAGLANAVDLNPDGLGQVLIYPYYTVNQGVLVNKGSTVRTRAQARGLQWGAAKNSSGLFYLQNTLKPTKPPRIYPSTVALSQARSQGYRPCSRCYPSTSMRAP